MTNEEIELEENKEEIIEEINYAVITQKYKNKLIKKLSIVFVSVFLIFLTTLFDKYAAFDIVLSSRLFGILLTVSLLCAVGIIIFMVANKDRDDEEKESGKECPADDWICLWPGGQIWRDLPVRR